uniref:Uncharacterized protein n=1 Tax=Siphoviridae sp. ctZHD14 TaxID=2827891 RepID=A0A8S5SVX2_9CAUD|nr:MAG TPA: hypothetical protein [Siphoviridae sp. ctZHD14]
MVLEGKMIGAQSILCFFCVFPDTTPPLAAAADLLGWAGLSRPAYALLFRDFCKPEQFFRI